MSKLQLPEEALSLIHQWLPFKPGALFPFELGAGKPDGRIEAMLTRAGFLSEEGKISNEAKEAFAVISEANATSRLRFLVDGDLLDYHVFTSPDRRRQVALKRGEDAFALTMPAESGEILDAISDFTGMAAFGTVPAAWALPLDESLVLAAIIDLLRRRTHAALAADEDQYEVRVTNAEISEILNRESLDSRWLTWIVQQVHPAEEIKVADVDATLNSLEEKQLLSKEDGSLVACGPVVLMARRLLQHSCLFMVEGFELSDAGEGKRTKYCIVQNGTRDFLLLETDGSAFGWQGISGQVCLSMLQHALRASTVPTATDNAPAEDISVAPEAPKPQAATPPPLASASKGTCPSCNNTLKPGARFCPKCGNSIN